eukprot:2252567-Amphidinium_carterae.1
MSRHSEPAILKSGSSLRWSKFTVPIGRQSRVVVYVAYLSVQDAEDRELTGQEILQDLQQHGPSIVLGDMNDENTVWGRVLEDWGWRQLVLEPTCFVTNQGTTIDRVYASPAAVAMRVSVRVRGDLRIWSHSPVEVYIPAEAVTVMQPRKFRELRPKSQQDLVAPPQDLQRVYAEHKHFYSCQATVDDMWHSWCQQATCTMEVVRPGEEHYCRADEAHSVVTLSAEQPFMCKITQPRRVESECKQRLSRAWAPSSTEALVSCAEGQAYHIMQDFIRDWRLGAAPANLEAHYHHLQQEAENSVKEAQAARSRSWRATVREAMEQRKVGWICKVAKEASAPPLHAAQAFDGSVVTDPGQMAEVAADARGDLWRAEGAKHPWEAPLADDKRTMLREQPYQQHPPLQLPELD